MARGEAESEEVTPQPEYAPYELEKENPGGVRLEPKWHATPNLPPFRFK